MKTKIVLTEDKLRSLIRAELNNVLNESTMNRVSDYIRNYECATITAWRNTLQDTTDNTFKPNHISHNKEKVNGKVIGRGKKVVGKPMQNGEDFSTEEKKYYNRELKAALLSLGYGVTQIRGSYKEYGQSESQEESLLVVNLKDDPKFKENIFKLSEYYNQDSFMYSPKGSDEGILIGTNNAPFPGYGEEIPSGKFKRDVQSMFMSRVGNKGFSFTNGDKVSKNDTNRKEKLDNGDNNYETDEPQTFADRKKQRIGESVERLLQIDTYDRYGINAKRAIKYYGNNLLKKNINKMNYTEKQITEIAYQQGKYKLNETSINRILKHGENGMIIISANRSSINSDNPNNSLKDEFEKWCEKEKVDYTDVDQQKFWLKERNKNAEADLKQALKASPFAYSPVYGGYHGTDSVVDEFEPSYIVYSHGKNYSADYEPFEKLYKFALQLCKKYKQDSVYIQPPHEAPYYVNGNGEKVSSKSSLDFKVNDDSQEFFTTSKRKKENPHKFTADIQFENMFRGSSPSTYFDRMKRRQSGEVFLDD